MNENDEEERRSMMMNAEGNRTNRVQVIESLFDSIDRSLFFVFATLLPLSASTPSINTLFVDNE